MVHKYCGSSIPVPVKTNLLSTNPLQDLGQQLGDRVAAAYQSLAFSEACEAALSLARMGNRYIDEQAPWTRYKQGQQQEVEEILYTVLESVRLAAYLLSPITPQISSAIYRQLGFSIDFNEQSSIYLLAPFPEHSRWGFLPFEQQLGEPQPVFQRLELPNSDRL
jgi:methionyl-tRNA synthetase